MTERSKDQASDAAKPADRQRGEAADRSNRGSASNDDRAGDAGAPQQEQQRQDVEDPFGADEPE